MRHLSLLSTCTPTSVLFGNTCKKGIPIRGSSGEMNGESFMQSPNPPLFSRRLITATRMRGTKRRPHLLCQACIVPSSVTRAFGRPSFVSPVGMDGCH
ncbi:hypothetical protein CEXT_189331 [Caerostris extrusa]|uniref:Secreted protein n=1 Tax=Caerostris extrusa TaxID=172846 RepID=A0AAV4TVW5_CAEEX|nr:hypothetical protein CEXT_189331 [Caerostris extrusa]